MAHQSVFQVSQRSFSDTLELTHWYIDRIQSHPAVMKQLASAFKPL
jgi:hypothetical protein